MNIRSLMNTRIKKGKKEISVQMPGYPACSLIKRKRARDSVFYIRQRAVCGDARISINLARWTEDNVPSEDELQRLLLESRANHLAICNGINPKEVDCRALTEIANLNLDLKSAYTVKDKKVVPAENASSLLEAFLNSGLRLLSVAGPALAALLQKNAGAPGVAPSSEPAQTDPTPEASVRRGAVNANNVPQNGAVQKARRQDGSLWGSASEEATSKTRRQNGAARKTSQGAREDQETIPQVVATRGTPLQNDASQKATGQANQVSGASRPEGVAATSLTVPDQMTGLAPQNNDRSAACGAPKAGAAQTDSAEDVTRTLRSLLALLAGAIGGSTAEERGPERNPTAGAQGDAGASCISGAVMNPGAGQRAHFAANAETAGAMNTGPERRAGADADAPEQLSLEVFCREYLRDKKLKEATRKFYESIIRVHLAPHFARFARIQDITGPRIAEFILRPLVDRELYSTAQNTRNTIVAVINHARLIHNLGAYGHLEQVKLLSQFADLKPKADYERSYAAMVNGDIGQNLTEIFRLFFERFDSVLLRGLLELSFHLCLRQNEILNIEVSDISFETHNLHIRQTKTITEKKGGFDVPLNSRTEELLRILMEAGEPIRKNRQAAGGAETTGADESGDEDQKDGSKGGGAQSAAGRREQKSEKNRNTDGPIFISARGEVLSTNTLSVYLGRIKEIKGRQTAHGIRAVFKTWASRSGISHEVSECVLSHRCWNKIDAAYNRDYGNYLYNDRKELMMKWSEYLAESIGENSLLWKRNVADGNKNR